MFSPFALLCAGLVWSATAVTAYSGLSEEDADRLGRDLTPVGAERAGNADGTIPEWTGGITEPPEGYMRGDHHPDPFPDDEPLFVITAENMDEYRDVLTAGHQALLETYRSYKIPVFPTRRTASFPERIYEATRRIATTARLESDGNAVAGAVVGIPFPIPSRAEEIVWNHLLRYRGTSVSREVSQAAPQRNGRYTLVQFEDEMLLNYVREGITEEELDNVLLFFKQKTVAPARMAGSILLVHETMDQVKEPRRAWVYNVGQRRVRRAPNNAYDAPGNASDGMRTADQLDIFNGAIDRYDWTLVGKKEMVIPYNSYQLHSDLVRYRDILLPLHINQALTRYELHRVWVVEARVRSDTSHIYARRTFYVDEDSWQIMVADHYDSRGNLWRVSEAHSINFYEVPVFWHTLEVHTDLLAGRYLVIGLDNESRPPRFNVERSPYDYVPASLRREGLR